jgi:hypothetical protein
MQRACRCRLSSARLQTRIFLCLLLAMARAGYAETNVAPYSKLRSMPYVGAAITYLTDGKIASPADNTLMLAAPLPIRTAQQMPLQYEFTFPQRLRVTGVRLLQHNTQGRRPATGYTIELDVRGAHHYDKMVVEERHARGGEWFQYSISPALAAYGLRFRTTSFAGVPGPNYGSSAIEEFEILTDGELPAKAVRSLPQAPILQEDIAHAKTIGAELGNSTSPESAQFQRGLFGSMWLYWSAGQKYQDDANYHNVALLRRLKVNRYWLYPGVYVPNRKDVPFLTLPENSDYLHFVNRQFGHRVASGSTYMTIVPFTSQIVPGYRDNVLGKFVAQMHKSGVRVIANESLLPYGLQAWDFPRVADPKVYPSVLSSSFVREASTTLYKELMEAGVDGLALGGDEFFLYGGTVETREDASTICKATDGSPRDICRPTSQELFKQRFGVPPAGTRGDFSSLAAKWKVFEYEQLATLFAEYARMMKSVNRDAIVTSLFRPGEENRPAYGIAYDVMGSLGAVTEMSSDPYWSHDSYLGHYYFANETKKLIGASKTRTAAITLQTTPRFDREGYEDPVMVYGPAFSGMMHGVRGINFYKQDYLFAGGKNDAGPWAEKFFNLTAYLERKGLLNYQVPKAVALLYSRASEDWWQLAHAANPVASVEAILYQNAVMEVLFRNGIPFDLYFLDQPLSLDAVSKYTTAILAYPYSISEGAVKKIRDAMSRGTKVIALQRKGEVDEYGKSYPKPVLYPLLGMDHLSIEFTRSSYADFSAQLMPLLLKTLGGEAPLTMDSNGKDVECAMLERVGGRLLFCLNWEKQTVEINLGIKLAEGTYTASVITLEHETPAGISGRSTLTAPDLKHFRLVLAPGEPKIVSVTALREGAGLSKRTDAHD